jgi:curli production assembly/transport component CsgE
MSRLHVWLLSLVLAAPPLCLPAENGDEGEEGGAEVEVPTRTQPNETGPVDEETIRHDGISGLIVDDTVTFVGREFYDAFAIAWLDYGLGDRYNLSIHELPTAASGSRVWVEYNRKTLFQVFLPPTRANIEATARTAAEQVARRFKTMELERALFTDPDLAPDEEF